MQFCDGKRGCNLSAAQGDGKYSPYRFQNRIRWVGRRAKLLLPFPAETLQLQISLSKGKYEIPREMLHAVFEPAV